MNDMNDEKGLGFLKTYVPQGDHTMVTDLQLSSALTANNMPHGTLCLIEPVWELIADM